AWCSPTTYRADSFGAARAANARGELIRSCTVRSWRRRIRLCGRFPYRPTIGGACGMYRPPIGPVSAIERAIVCMRMPGLADLRQPISRGFLHTATSGGAPGFFYARCARNQVAKVVISNDAHTDHDKVVAGIDQAAEPNAGQHIHQRVRGQRQPAPEE